MPNVTYVHPDGAEEIVDVSAGESIMQAALANGIDGITAECGGSCMCATCHVYVEDGRLEQAMPINPVENEMLESTASERRPTSRLSCQLAMTPELDGLVVHLPEAQV